MSVTTSWVYYPGPVHPRAFSSTNDLCQPQLSSIPDSTGSALLPYVVCHFSTCVFWDNCSKYLSHQHHSNCAFLCDAVGSFGDTIPDLNLRRRSDMLSWKSLFGQKDRSVSSGISFHRYISICIVLAPVCDIPYASSVGDAFPTIYSSPHRSLHLPHL
jgi:hypothetical protein